MWRLNDLFPGCLKPKHHLLLHYPDFMRRLGPLSQFFTIRSESKHRDFTITAHLSFSRVNICKTLAIKSQLVLNHRFLQRTYFNNRLYAIEYSESPKVLELPNAHKFMLQLPVSSCDNVQVAKLLTFQGEIVKFGTVIMFPTEGEYVLNIVQILASDSASMLLIITRDVTKGTYYDEHYQGYRLNPDYSECQSFYWKFLTAVELSLAYFFRICSTSSGKLFIHKRWI